MDDTLVFASALMVALLGASRFVVARHAGIALTVRHGTWFALTQAAAMVVSAPATVALLDRASPVGNSGVLLGDLLRMAAVRSLALLADALPTATPGLAARRAPRRTGRSRWPIVVSALLFLLARTSEVGNAEAVNGAAGRLLLAGHDALTAGYTCFCLAVFVLALDRCARAMAPCQLRQGLAVLKASAVVGAVWAAWGVDDVVDILRSGVQNGGEDLVSGVLGLACIALAVCGGTVSLWPPVFRRAGRWLTDYRRYLALGPLWRASYDSLPDIALRAPSPRWLAWLPPRDAQFALYRRVIEIRDGQRARPPGGAAQAVPAVPGGHRAGGGAEPASLEAETDSLLRAAAALRRTGRTPV
ncbi:hypothetical protein GXW83_13735 [Streptacidiphilus sp. PB12-B1b]|uniref:MAB_1171c family putative transporter n=1 Tax=Streptacidiphilus sp. PB12-B1b TaxID=2705012 RepID=UPI0015F9640C|nr:MAB_1171c family putative transporter [Streptacidiphilus sp. PB12-B1b]QMU76649.1 hypothetical protein GXW83_13735 [Streptacidiphilus sp. PB12-B1b]